MQKSTGWKTEYQQYPDGTHICVANQNGDWIADCGKEGDVESEANAAFVAASPDMYRALKTLIEKYWKNKGSGSGEFISCITPKDIPDYWRKADEAISKAEGK